MLLILLKSSACLAVFMLFYKLGLEKTSAHTFKRFYLIGVLLISIGIPFITLTEYIIVEPTLNFATNLEPQNNLNIEFTEIAQPKNYLPTILWTIYLIGMSIFLIRFLKNLNNLFQKIKRNPKLKNENTFHVLLQELITPHTFLNYIFLNKAKYEKNQIPQEVLLHEQTHANQKHALDVIFIETLQILFWFNPLLYFIKKDIKLNHEFLADQAVLNKGIVPSTYQNILLAFSSNAPYTPLANAINYSLIKKRFTVMKTKTSKPVLWLRSLIILPLLAILIYSFSERLEVEKEVASFESLTIQETDKGATEAMMKEYIEFINEVEKSNTIWAPKLNRTKAIYDIMTEAQRATVKKLPKTPLSNLATVKPKTPTVTEFNSWKNSNKFAIWIDGKNVSNETLNNYSSSDITYYFVSKVYKNAQTKKHPQPFQNNLYTKKGFEESYLKRNVKTYNALKKEYQNAQKTLKQGDSELRILKARLDQSYNSLSKEEIKNYSAKKVKSNIKTKKQLSKYSIITYLDEDGLVLIPNGWTSMSNLKMNFNNIIGDLNKVDSTEIELLIHKKSTEISIAKTKDILSDFGTLKVKMVEKIGWTSKHKKPQQKATPKQLTEYNKLAKKYNAQPENKRVIKLKDINHLEYLYGLMTKEQKATSEPFPNCPPPPPPATKVPQFKNGEKLTLNEIIKKTPKNIESGYEMLDNGESHYFTLYKGKKTYYNKDGYITDEKGNVLPPPPPPPIENSNQNLSEELQKIKQDYNTKSEKYANAIGLYVKKNNGDPEKIKMLYNETMATFKQYIKLAKKENVLAPPPPPAPISPLNHVIKMAKKGATFYYNDKKITSDKAIELLKKNKDLNISTNTNDGINVVKIQTEPITISH